MQAIKEFVSQKFLCDGGHKIIKWGAQAAFSMPPCRPVFTATSAPNLAAFKSEQEPLF